MRRLKILIADDMEHVRLQVEHRITKCARDSFRADITLAESAEEAVELASASHFDLALLDIDFKHSLKSAGHDGLWAAKNIRTLSADTHVVLVSALGGTDILNQVDQDPSIERFFRRTSFTDEDLYWTCLWALITKMHSVGAIGEPARTIRTQSGPMREFLRAIDRVKPDRNVMIYGETGTGKELCARRVSANAQFILKQSSRPFIALNCAAVPEGLIDSILCGYVKGAFTGAAQDTPGLLEQAQDGDFLLDELQSAPIVLQQKLMRIIQEKSFTPVGGNKPVTLRVRFISVMNESPEETRAKGRVMPDLIARLQQDYAVVPALRERPDDITYLAEFFLRKYGASDKEFSAEALQFLATLTWPENIRGLEKVVTAAYTHTKIPVITLDALKRLQLVQGMSRAPQADSQALPVTDTAAYMEKFAEELISSGKQLTSILTDLERAYFKKLQDQKRSITKMQELSGVPRNTIKRKLTGFGFPVIWKD